MKNIINLYAGLCVLALSLKYAIRIGRRLNGRKTNGHADEHGMADLIKFILVILIAIFVFWLNT